MVTKREKLQYAYVFLTDVLALFVSVALVHLVAGRIWSRILPYDWTDWVQTLTLLAIAFTVTFLNFNQDENIVGRRLGAEIKLSLKFNILMAAVPHGSQKTAYRRRTPLGPGNLCGGHHHRAPRRSSD